MSDSTSTRPAADPSTRVGGWSIDDETPVFVISVAAQLAGMHAQTLRQYDRLGLVRPSRTRGGGRRYSAADVAALREVQRLSQEGGVSLAGIQRILHLERTVLGLQRQVNELTNQLAIASGRRVFAAEVGGDVYSLAPGQRPPRARREHSAALVRWRPVR